MLVFALWNGLGEQAVVSLYKKTDPEDVVELRAVLGVQEQLCPQHMLGSRYPLEFAPQVSCCASFLPSDGSTAEQMLTV